MTDLLDVPLTRSPEAVGSEVADELVLLHLTNGIYYGLNSLGTRIWQLLGTGMSPRAICAELADEFEVPVGIIENDARSFLADLMAQGIVTEGEIS